ncbi:MAG: low molecular weight phosphotyrosine protein phosphatase [Akkermansia sp.]|nr:low molecular weight phosphotyrosine protein phosphatase [Akkermansia sp.]
MNGHTRNTGGGQPQSALAGVPFRVLFVCLGNICRSPAAEMIFNALLAERGLQGRIRCDSCGVAAYHVGQKPDSRMLAALKRAGIPYNGHRGRQFSPADFDAFDLIIPQDTTNREDILCQARKSEDAAKVVPMSRWFPADTGLDEVPDPYYGGPHGFDLVVELLRAACTALCEDLAARGR